MEKQNSFWSWIQDYNSTGIAGINAMEKQLTSHLISYDRICAYVIGNRTSLSV